VELQAEPASADGGEVTAVERKALGQRIRRSVVSESETAAPPDARTLAEELFAARKQLSDLREEAFRTGQDLLPLLELGPQRQVLLAQEALTDLAREAGGVLRVDMGGWFLEVQA